MYIVSKIYTFASNIKLLSTTDILITTKNSIDLHEFWIAGFGFWLVLFLLSNGVEGFRVGRFFDGSVLLSIMGFIDSNGGRCLCYKLLFCPVWGFDGWGV